MAVNVSIWQLAEGRYRLRCRVTGLRDAYRFVRGSQADASHAAAAWRAEVEQHGLAPASGSITLGGWLAQLMIMATHLQPLTKRRYETTIALHFGAIAGKRLVRLTPADGVNFQVRLLDEKVGVVVVGECFRIAKWALGEAARMRIIPSNPFLGVRRVHGRPADVKTPTGAHLAAVHDAAEGRTGLLLRLALTSGARRNELLALCWKHVDLTAGTISIAGSLEQLDGVIRTKSPKTRSGRRSIELPANMLADLRTARAAAGAVALAAGRALADLPVLPASDGLSFWSPFAATQAARRALAAADIPGSLHGLRHAHATALLQGRVNPRAVQQRLGHSNIQTTLAHYAHAMPGDGAAAVAAITNAMKGRA